MLVLSNLQSQMCKIYKCDYAIMTVFKFMLISKVFLVQCMCFNVDFLSEKRKIYKKFSCKLYIIVMIFMITQENLIFIITSKLLCTTFYS